MLQVNDALGAAGRARRIHPERHFVAMGIGFVQRIGEIAQPVVGDNAVRHRIVVRGAVDDHQSAQSGCGAGRHVEPRREFGIGHRNRSAGIRQIELQQIRRRQRVDQQRNEASAHGTEEGCGISRRIIEEQQHTIAACKAQRAKAVAPARCLGAEFGIAAQPGRTDDGESIPAPGRKIIEQDTAGVVTLRHRKTDLNCAGTVARDLIRDRRGVILTAHDRTSRAGAGCRDAS